LADSRAGPGTKAPALGWPRGRKHKAEDASTSPTRTADFSLPCVPARLPPGDEYPAGAVGAGCGGRVVTVALHVLILVVMGACGRPACERHKA
jgi:hypothetical protein